MYRLASRVALLAGAVLALAADLALVASFARATDPAPAAALVELTVRVQGLKNDRGQVAVALFASASGFPQRERAVRGQLARIQGGRAQVTLHALRPGTYAVAILHDENGNAKMDFNFL